MRLTVDDRSISDPTPHDIAAAIPDRPPSDPWRVSIARTEREALAATAHDGRHYRVTYSLDGGTTAAAHDLDAQHLREIFTLYHAADDAWRHRLVWAGQERSPPPAAATTTWPVMIMPLVFIAAAVGFPVLVGWLGRMPSSSPLTPAAVPEATPTQLLIAVLALGLAVVVAVLIGKLAGRRTVAWHKTSGRITRTKPLVALVRTEGPGPAPEEHVPELEYEYQVDGRSYRASRVSLAPPPAPGEIGPTPIRYLEGQAVTVYFDPKHPAEATLDPAVPQHALLGCATLLAVGGLAVVAIMFLATNGHMILKAYFPDANPALIFLFGFPGIFILALALSLLRGLSVIKRWPAATGIVTTSEIRPLGLAAHGAGGAAAIAERTHTTYLPVVEYSYTVGGKAYAGRTVRLDTELSGRAAYASRITARYPVGSRVQVRYDPADHSRAALEFRADVAWLLLVAAAALLVLAAWGTGALTGAPPIKTH